MGPDDPTDPFVTTQATTLNNDPNMIYAFVRDQIKFEAYPGSLRGARGTLWAMAGNTLDKASLLVALLQASGFTTQYEHTTLSSTSAGNQALSNLIYSMFPQTPVLLGCIPINTPTDDPAGNGAVRNWTNDYYWVQYGPGNINLDPNIPNGQPGQTVQAPDYNFTTVATALQQQVTVKINAEIYNQASGLFGFGPSTTTVLSETFYAWQLAGNIISAGNLVQSTSTGSLDISATTFTYTPYLLIGSRGEDVTQDTVITGTSYQEYYTNFPLSSQIVTGIFVQVYANDVWLEQQQTPYTHTLFDRIGPAVRQGNSSAQIVTPATPTPAVSNFDIATLNILPTRLSVNTFQSQQARLNYAYQNYQALLPQFQTLPTSGTLTAAQQVVAQQMAALSKYLLIAENEMITMAYDGAADQLAGQLQTGYWTRVYPSAPRVTIANSSMDSSGNAQFYLDVLKNDMFVIDGLGNSRGNPYGATYYEEVGRGMIESTIEATILSQVTGATNAVDIGTVMATLADPNQLIGLGPSPNNTVPPSTTALDSTTLSADAQTLILDAVQNGDQVITPNQMVTINGNQTVGWWETDQYGHTVSHFPNGNHQAFLEYGAVNEFAEAWQKPIVQFIGQMEGAALAGIAFSAAALQSAAANASFTATIKAGKSAVGGIGSTDNLTQFFQDFAEALQEFHEFLPAPEVTGVSLLQEYSGGLGAGIEQAQIWIQRNLPGDPNILPFIGTPLGALPTGVTSGNSPGVTVNLSTDSFFTYPFNGNNLPVYDVNIVNTGPTADTFNLSPRDNSGQFRVWTSVPSLTLLPGQAGEANLCILPGDSTGVSVPPLNSVSQFQVTATGQSSGASATNTTNFTVPAIPTVAITVNPPVLTVSPGGTVNANLIFTSVGNSSPGSVALSATAGPGIAIGGLPSSVSIPLSGAVSAPVTFTAAANDPVNLYYVVVSTTYTTGIGSQTASFTVPVAVQSLGTCTLNAALTAQQTGATTLGNTLATLATDMNAAAAAPSNPAFVSRIAGDLSVIDYSLSNISYLQSFTSSIAAAGSAVASATPATLLNALTSLDTAICAVGSTLSQASNYNTQISLLPNSLVTGPNLPATYTVVLYNPSTTTKVYTLSVTGVPSGVTSQFNFTSVTLGPNGQYTDYSNSYGLTPITLTLTPGASFTAPFTFNVMATPVGATEFAISAPGTLLVRPQQISIDSVTVTPAYGPPGTQFVVTARVFAEVNQNEQVYLQTNAFSSSGQNVVSDINSQSIQLSPTSTLQTVTLLTINSTNYANGSYTLSVQGFNSNNQSLAGATAAGSFLVGAPLSGMLTANANSTPPGTIPPGSSAVQVALHISRDTTPNPVSTLVGTAALQGISRSMVLYPNGQQQLAYACSDSYVNIVDVTNQASPQVLGTFANNLLTTENGFTVPGFESVSCAIYNNNFIMSYSRADGNNTSATIPTHFATFSLTNPLSPVQVGSVVDIQRSDSAGLYVAGNTALMYQSTTSYNATSMYLTSETGDIWSAGLASAPTNGTITYLNDVYSCGAINPDTNQCTNVTNVPTATNNGGVCTSPGTAPVPNSPTGGGPYRIGLGTAVNSTTSYFASTNAYGTNVENPTCPQITGQLLVVDTTNPSSPALLTSVSAPAMAFMTGIAVQGGVAVAVGDSTGVYNIASGYVGTLAISSFDISGSIASGSSPTNPVLLNSVTTQLADSAGSFIVPLGQNTFAVGNTTLGGNAELVLVDATNPSALRYIPYNALFVANPTIAQNGYFFALSATPASTTNSLSVFQLSEIAGPQLTVKLNLPTTNCQNTSFSLAPGKCTPGTAFDTYEFDQPTPNTITFTVNLTGVNPGDVDTVVTGGEMDYTLPTLGAGTIPLGPLTVLSQQILNISPASQNVSNAGNSASYTVTVGNPTDTPQTFVPSTLGIPASWGVQLPASVTVAPGSSQTYNLVLTTPLNAPAVTYNFFAVVSTAGGITASVGASLGVNNLANSGSGNENSSFVTFTATVNPTSVTIGQNGAATFQLSITNTGNVGSTIGAVNGSPTFSGNSAYNGWNINFTPTQGPNVLPGLRNTVTLTGTLTLPNANSNSTAPGSYPIQIQVQNGGTVLEVPLTVVIVGAGVTANLSPGNGTPATSYSLSLNNVGNVTDSYNLSVQGALAQVAGIQSSVGPIAAGRSAQVPIAMNPVDFVSPGSYTLQVKAVSQANPAIVAYATAGVQVSGSKGVSAAITPSSTGVQTLPGSVSLLLQVTNTGNVPDTYTAAITGITGPVTATLNGGQSVALFPIPTLGSSEFPLNATVNGPAPATITVTVTSLSNGAITSRATVTIDNSTPGPPTAVAAAGGNTPVHRLAVLNASGSSDPNNLPLTFLWTLTSAPAGSALNSGSISLAGSAFAAFRPDFLGTYTFNVNVSNGTASANAAVTYTAVDVPPVAVTANNYNTAVGAFAFLNGKNSYDPDGQPITFAWSLVDTPTGSAVTTSSIYNSQTTHAFFTPDVAGAYQFQLIVTDATASSLPALITVTAYSGTIPPNADAGPSQNIGLHATVTVNGSNSVDPNTSALPLTYQWTLTAVPTGSGATLANATSALAQFTPDLPGIYVASLVVSNANGTSPAATTTVYAYSGDVPPNANAGASQFVTPTSTVNLNSQTSADPDNGPLRLAFLWWLDSLPSASTATLQQANTATPNFVADKSGYYIGRVEANDGLLAGFANTLVVSAATCDADANGVINRIDIELIQAAIGQTVPANDPRDYLHTGTITAADVTACSNLVSTTPPTLQVLPVSFTETLMQGSPAVMQALQISSSGNPIGFTVTSNQPWLTASVTSDSTSSIGSLNAIVTPGSLAPNTYTGMLTFTPASGSAQTVSVTLTIVSPSPIGVSPSSLMFAASYLGAAPASQAVSVTSNSGPVNFTVVSDSPWLSGGVSSGTTPQTLNVTATPGTLAPGAYTGNLTITAGANTAKVSVTFNITEAGSACDVNQDGLINVLDVQKLINEALGTLAATNDLNHDAVVNVVDVQIDSNAALGLGCSAH
jgi:uncharacterized membrane protein